MTALARRQQENLLIEGAQIAFKPNFEGREEQFNREGDRYFNVELSPEQAESLAQQGWNVKQWQNKKEEDAEIVYFLKVAVSYKVKQPRVVLVSSNGRTPLDEGTCDMIDWLDLEFIDVTLNPYRYTVNGNTGIKAYLKTGMFIVREDPLEKKYSHLPLIGVDLQALPPGEDPDVLDGEVVAEWDDDPEMDLMDSIEQREIRERKAIEA